MTAANGRRLVVVSAGLSVPSTSRMLAGLLADATVQQLSASEVTADVQVVELRELAVAITDCLVQGFANDELTAAIQTLAEADGAILVTPIFTASYSGLFKSFLDVLDPNALTGLPVLLGATGGTERHSLALDYAIRPVLSYLHARTMPTAVYAATSDWGASRTAGGDIRLRVARAAGELAREMSRADAAGIARIDPYAIPAGFDPSGARASGH